VIANKTFLIMKKLVPLIALAACFTISQAHAQVTDAIPKAATGKMNAGSLITQLANNIKPSSFLDSWAGNKSGWLSSAGKIADATGFGKSISSLAGSIKPDMFKQGFNVSNLIQSANSLKSISTGAGLLKSLEGGLKPEAFASGWADKSKGWLSALSMLK